MMSRKDYIKVAELLNANKNTIDQNAFDAIVHQFCDLFFEDNNNFSSNRFELACNK
jgi:tryptophan 2,3-dioxygenase